MRSIMLGGSDLWGATQMGSHIIVYKVVNVSTNAARCECVKCKFKVQPETRHLGMVKKVRML
jgi:hypothetical protein